MSTTFKNALIESKFTISVELGGDNVTGQPVTISALNEQVTINSGTTPDGAYCFTDKLPMTGSAVSMDFLDGLIDIEGNTITMTGQKVRAVKFKNPSTNTGNITIVGAASNGLLLFGAAGSIVLTPGTSILLYLENDGVTIDATHCMVEATGTNLDSLHYAVVIG